MDRPSALQTEQPAAAHRALSRREALRLIAATASGIGALAATAQLQEALAAGTGAPVVWINDGGDDLNLLAQLGRSRPRLLELAAGRWDLQVYDALRPVGSAMLDKPPPGAPVLVLESLPPLDSVSWERLAPWVQSAKVVIALGTEACFGGLYTPRDATQRLAALCRINKTPLIRLPGVPVPPQHLVGVLAHLEFVGFPMLDSQLRPQLYYAQPVCDHCERRGDLEAGRFAAGFGRPGCLLHLGCKGPVTHNSCSTVRWNEGANWCVGAGGPCTGCAEPGYPDHGGIGLYGRLPGDRMASRSLWLENLDWLGRGLAVLTAAGIGLHLLRRWLARSQAATGRERS